MVRSSSISDLTDIDLLIVDGPPGSTGTRARFPAYPLLSERLAPSALILVDDLQRSDERAVVDAWLEMGGVSELPTYGRDKRFCIVPLRANRARTEGSSRRCGSLARPGRGRSQASSERRRQSAGSDDPAP